MKPSSFRSNRINRPLQLINTDLRQLIIINDCPTPRPRTLDNITRRGLTEFLPVDTPIQPHTRLKCTLDLLRCHGGLCREDGHEVQ